MVSKILKSNDTFTVVNLSGNNLTEKGFSYICKALRRNKAIIHLDLKHTVRAYIEMVVAPVVGEPTEHLAERAGHDGVAGPFLQQNR